MGFLFYVFVFSSLGRNRECILREEGIKTIKIERVWITNIYFWQIELGFRIVDLIYYLCMYVKLTYYSCTFDLLFKYMCAFILYASACTPLSFSS